MAADPAASNRLELGPETPELRAIPADRATPGLDMGTASSEHPGSGRRERQRGDAVGVSSHVTLITASTSPNALHTRHQPVLPEAFSEKLNVVSSIFQKDTE